MKIKSFSHVAFTLLAPFLFIGCSSIKSSKSTLSNSEKESTIFELISNPDDSRIKNRNFEQVPTIAASADGKQVVWTPVIGERNELSATVELPNAKKILLYAGIGIGVLALLLIAFFLGRRGKKAAEATTAKDPAEENRAIDSRDENS